MTDKVNLFTIVHGGTRYTMKILNLLKVPFEHKHIWSQQLPEIMPLLDGRKTIFVSRDPDSVADTIFREKLVDYGETAPQLTCDLVVDWFYLADYLMDVSPNHTRFIVGTKHPMVQFERLTQYLGVEPTNPALELVKENRRIGHNERTESAMKLPSGSPLLRRLNRFRSTWI